MHNPVNPTKGDKFMPSKNSKRATKRKAQNSARPKTDSAVSIPIIGTVGPKGIVLDAEEEDKRARREAKAVTAFLNGHSPDFLTEAMLATIDDAFDHFGMARPQDDCGQAEYDENNLYPLFLKTKLVSNLRWCWVTSLLQKISCVSYSFLNLSSR